MILRSNRNNEKWQSILPLMKGEIKEGVVEFHNVSNLPLDPLLHKEGGI
jgi:hypothetical protein